MTRTKSICRRVVEEITTAISRLAMGVRHRSQFQLHLQGQGGGREAGARELGVRYVLEGS